MDIDDSGVGSSRDANVIANGGFDQESDVFTSHVTSDASSIASSSSSADDLADLNAQFLENEERIQRNASSALVSDDSVKIASIDNSNACELNALKRGFFC